MSPKAVHRLSGMARPLQARWLIPTGVAALFAVVACAAFGARRRRRRRAGHHHHHGRADPEFSLPHEVVARFKSHPATARLVTLHGAPSPSLTYLLRATYGPCFVFLQAVSPDDAEVLASFVIETADHCARNHAALGGELDAGGLAAALVPVFAPLFAVLRDFYRDLPGPGIITLQRIEAVIESCAVVARRVAHTPFYCCFTLSLSYSHGGLAPLHTWAAVLQLTRFRYFPGPLLLLVHSYLDLSMQRQFFLHHYRNSPSGSLCRLA